MSRRLARRGVLASVTLAVAAAVAASIKTSLSYLIKETEIGKAWRYLSELC